MHVDDSLAEGRANVPIVAYCEESRRLLNDFAEAVQDVLLLHEQQFLAIIAGDSDCSRFDLLIHMANEKKQEAKYAYLHHVDTHGCSKYDAIDNSRARENHG